MNWTILFVALIIISLMVIYDLNIKHIAIIEAKADAPLIIDTNAPLTFAVASQRLQSVARRYSEVIK